MLEELTVEGYALLDKVTVRFSEGLNVLSGETGAGKSILVDALGLILGGKADSSAVRAGKKEATVSGVIRAGNCPKAVQWLADHGISIEDGAVIIRRRLTASGKGQLYVQSAPATRSEVAELTSFLFDLHGQHEHQSLLKKSAHREMIDLYAKHEALAGHFHRDFIELSSKKRELASLVSDERERLREHDILTFAATEIDDAQLRIGEEEDLEQNIRLLSQGEKLYGLLVDFYSQVAESRGGSLALLRKGSDDLTSIVQIDDSLSELSNRLESAFFEIEDIVDSIRQYQDSVDFSPERLEECDDRLTLIRKLEKKYGASIDDVLSYRRKVIIQKQKLENWEEDKSQLAQDIADLEKKVLGTAKELSSRRKAAAKQLEGEVREHLSHLGMPKAKFKIVIEAKESNSGRPVCGPWGMDDPEFLISANPGEPPQPLRRIASGGEMSRVMLALKTVLADTDSIRSLIFDEIDAGIGGEVAIAVGNHLKTLAEQKQVLCVTHLATIAVNADNHLKVEKSLERGRTVTSVRSVSGDNRIAEIARMLAGDSIGETSRSHAEEMLRAASGAV